MYIVEVYYNTIPSDIRNIYVKDSKQLERIISLSIQTGYIINSVKKIDLELAKDFIKMLIKDAKPKGLVFGTKIKRERKND